MRTRKSILTFLCLLSLATSVDAQVPAKLQNRILKFAPEMDADGDRQISDEELRAGRETLPEDLQVMLDAALSKQGNSTVASVPAKFKPLSVDVPVRNGAAPFLDPIFTCAKTQDVQYATAKSGDTEMPLLLDVYQPSPNAGLPQKLPAMILLFGGGWIKGGKDVKYIRDLSEYYATRGYVAISVQYRIQKDNPPPVPGPGANPESNGRFRLINAAIQDTANAVRWVRENSAKYQIDPDRIAIGGVSAGAFNSLYVGLCDEEIVGPDAKVAAVISLMGAMESKYIDKDDPPVFIAHGTSDNVAPYAMVESMVNRLDEVEAAYAFYPVDGAAHRLQTILETEFDGKSVQEHSLDFCFKALKLSELTE